MNRRARRTLRSALALTAIAISGTVVHANAPAGQYAAFNRTDHCISDQATRLTWMRAPIVGTLDLAHAAKACAAIGADAGPAPWRVPSVNELETLVDEDAHYELEGSQLVLKAIDANAFPATPVNDSYWTSSVVPGGSSAWAVYFKDGSTTLTPVTQSSLAVRCVTEWTDAGAPADCPF